MTKNDFNSDPLEPADPLSATGMFLSSFGSTPAQESSDADIAKSHSGTPVASSSGPGTTRTDWAPAAAPPAPPPSGSGAPGEFTKMFQAMDQRPSPPPVSHTPASSPATQPAPPQGPGEFTRAFVAGSTPIAEQPVQQQRIPDRPPIQQARTVIEPPPIPAPAPNPSRMKGFSTPGVSDSASGEGSFTQFFKATPSAPASTPPPVQSYRPATPAPAPPPAPEKPWREPEFNVSAKPVESSSTSATGLLSSLSSPGMSAPAPRQPEPAPYRPEPLPSYTPAPPPSEPSPAEAGSVTQLIQRLSQVPRETPAAPAAPTAVPPPPMSSSLGEPGEFTRMISGSAVRSALGNTPATAPPPQPAAPPPPAATPIAMPHVAVPAAPAIPAIHPPALPAHQAAAPPKFEAPRIEAPKIAPPAAPALAAPKSKLEALVPILLVINTFLLVVLLVVVIFALKAK